MTDEEEKKPPLPVIETEDESDARSTIFQLKDLQEEMVYVRDWKMYILIRALTGDQRAGLLQATTKGKIDMRKMYPDMVILTARHAKTEKLIFKAADREELLKKSGGALEQLALAAARLSGITEQAQEDARKN